MNIVYIHDANIKFGDAQGYTNLAYFVITENGSPVSVCTYDNDGNSIIFDWDMIEEPAREKIEKLLPTPEPKHEDYVMAQLNEAISYLSEEVEVGERIDEGYDSWSSTDTVYLKHAMNALNRIKEHLAK